MTMPAITRTPAEIRKVKEDHGFSITDDSDEKEMAHARTVQLLYHRPPNLLTGFTLEFAHWLDGEEHIVLPPTAVAVSV
jgi:hypothetical protein